MMMVDIHCKNLNRRICSSNAKVVCRCDHISGGGPWKVY